METFSAGGGSLGSAIGRLCNSYCTVRRQFAHTSLYRELRPERGRGKLTKPPLGQVMSAQHK